MKIYFYLLFSISFSLSNTFSGYVLDEESGNPIENVEIILSSNQELIANSKKDGHFIIDIENIEIDSILFNHIAYINKAIPISELKNKLYLKKDVLYGDIIEVTSSRKEKKVSDSPILTHIISSKDLESTATLDFYQSLQMIIPNIMFAPDYHGVNLKIQGLDSEYILILIDGDRIAGNTVGNIDFSKFNTEQIKRIEILKGNASTLYGSNAIGGVINIITKSVENQTNSFILNSKYGSYNSLNNSGTFNTFFKKIASKTDFSIKSSDGYFLQSLTAQDTLSLRKRRFNDYNISQSFKYKKDDLTIKFSGNYYKHDWYRPLEQKGPEIFPSQNDRKQYEAYSIKLKEKNHLTSINGHYNFSYTFDKYIKYHVIDGDYTINSDDVSYEWTNHSVQQISSLLYLFKDKLNITLGLDLLNETGESKDVVVDDEAEPLLESELGENESITFRTNAFFIQTDYAFLEKINLFLGARYTNHNFFEDRLTSQLSIKYSFNENHFRFNLGQGYRVPNIYELYYDWTHTGDGFKIEGNPNLKPEESLNLTLSYQKFSNNWNFMLSLQRNQINNMISELRNPNKDFYYENYDKTSVNSLEANLSLELNKINYELAYNFTRIIDEITYTRLPDISEHILNLNIYKKIKKYNFTISGNINYYGEKTIFTPTTEIETDIPSYYQTNISIIKNGFSNNLFLEKINLKLGINNLFNYTNLDDTTFQSPGRIYFSEISFKHEF